MGSLINMQRRLSFQENGEAAIMVHPFGIFKLFFKADCRVFSVGKWLAQYEGSYYDDKS